jgi:D-alanyl-D-alanine carboxypeptidase
MTVSTRTIAVALAAAIAVAASPGPARAEAAEGLPALDGDKLAGIIAGLPDDQVSAALVQIRGPAGEWAGTSGTTSLRNAAPPRPDSRFRIGSITKVFTAVVVLQLMAEKRIDLDRPIERYLPHDFPPRYPDIPVRDLLDFTSGLNSKFDVDTKDPEWFLEHRFDHVGHRDHLDTSQLPSFPPGTAQRYADIDYLMLGLLVERVTGHSWASEVHRRIIDPLHLTGTSTPADDPRIPGPHVHGYEATDDGWVDISAANPSLQWSAASMISTAPDLDRLLVALFGGRLLPAAQLEEMFTVPDVPLFGSTKDRASIGAPFTRTVFNGVTIWAKSGDRPGYNNAMASTRDLSRRLVYSVNPLHMGTSEPPAVAKAVIGATFVGQSSPAARST